MTDLSEQLQQQVQAAAASQQALCIQGGNTKAFYGHPCTGDVLALNPHRDIVHYEPSELILTARAGTPLQEIHDTLAAQGQMLAFEPPAFGAQATIGGTIACNFSGPRRAFCGAARDFVLGIKCLTGHAEILRFGGEVMKNVAGYDVSRLFTGAMGTLGVILEVSLKVLPRPAEEISLVLEHEPGDALQTLNHWCASALPLSGAAYDGERVILRLSGAASAVRAARKQIGGELLADGDAWWQRLREQQLTFFQQAKPLWRLSLPPATPLLGLPGKSLWDWGGALRWLVSDAPAPEIRKAVSQRGGHATLFRAPHAQHAPVFSPLPAPVMRIHQRLKQAFDPQHLFNRGRWYPDM